MTDKMKDIFNGLHKRGASGVPPLLETTARKEAVVEEEDEMEIGYTPKDVSTWLEDNADEELTALLDDVGMTMEDLEDTLNELKKKGARKKSAAGPKGGPKGDSKDMGVKFKGKVPGTGGKFNMKKCIASKVADRKFKVKNTKKYPSKAAAARALCAWIISRSKRTTTQPKMRGSRGPGRGYSGKAFKGWAPGSGKGGKPLKFSPAQLRKMKKARTASTDEPNAANVIIETVLDIVQPDLVEEVISALDLFFEGDVSFEELQAYVEPRLEEEESWKDLEDVLGDIEGVEEEDLDPDTYTEEPEEGEEEEGSEEET